MRPIIIKWYLIAQKLQKFISNQSPAWHKSKPKTPTKLSKCYYFHATMHFMDSQILIPVPKGRWKDNGAKVFFEFLLDFVLPFF